ncbi:hypothetical protein GCM10023264_15350 [Sphingomonas daechungensis]|uniref:PepSY domain-containing protein n=1 Tax=Sphingomonas daechungensis TaxID=1176646 RepID=A0ABX6T663_9SPHN|nr:hypothetical protein [Sphingomonas daechungensis]QNP44198.1 hypothetical protein H9L15_06800 [Sphingomonas daechungensis]
MLGLLLAAASVTAVDAERAFAADAQKLGQWTAFRKYADDTAVMFNPQAVWASEFLAPLKDPPKAIGWGPSDSWVSCDGRTAINRGPWTSASGKSHGYFTTVWMRDGKGWKWTYDGGDSLAKPMPLPKQPKVERASCTGREKIPGEYREEVKPTARIAGKPPADAGQGRSADGTLIYEWRVAASGERRFEAKIWNGRDYRTILDQHVSAPSE